MPLGDGEAVVWELSDKIDFSFVNLFFLPVRVCFVGGGGGSVGCLIVPLVGQEQSLQDSLLS